MEEVKNMVITNPEPEGEQESRWQHPEKQKTLIHTAPVLAPVLSVVSNNSSAGSAIRAVRGRGRDDPIKSTKDVSHIIYEILLYFAFLFFHINTKQYLFFFNIIVI